MRPGIAFGSKRSAGTRSDGGSEAKGRAGVEPVLAIVLTLARKGGRGGDHSRPGNASESMHPARACD